MNEDQLEQLKKLILNEIAIKEKFRTQYLSLNDLIDIVTYHVNVCYKWWEQNLPKALAVVVIMNDGASFELSRPQNGISTKLSSTIDFKELEVKCKDEFIIQKAKYLPLNMVFEKCHIVNIYAVI